MTDIMEAVLAKYTGKNNSGKPKADFVRSLFAMTNEELYEACKQYIWLSAYAGNNPRSDFHWMCDACYDAAKARDESAAIYSEAYNSVSKELGFS